MNISSKFKFWFCLPNSFTHSSSTAHGLNKAMHTSGLTSLSFVPKSWEDSMGTPVCACSRTNCIAWSRVEEPEGECLLLCAVCYGTLDSAKSGLLRNNELFTFSRQKWVSVFLSLRFYIHLFTLTCSRKNLSQKKKS